MTAEEYFMKQEIPEGEVGYDIDDELAIKMLNEFARIKCEEDRKNIVEDVPENQETLFRFRLDRCHLPKDLQE